MISVVITVIISVIAVIISIISIIIIIIGQVVKTRQIHWIPTVKVKGEVNLL